MAQELHEAGPLPTRIVATATIAEGEAAVLPVPFMTCNAELHRERTTVRYPRKLKGRSTPKEGRAFARYQTKRKFAEEEEGLLRAVQP